MKTNTLFMAFSAGKESVESTPIKRYVGVAPVTILAVNPTKAEQEKLYNTTLDKEPEYVGTVTDASGKSVQNVRLTFVVKTVAEKCDGVELVSNATFFLQNAPRVGSQSGKYQVIDKYGRTAWATREDIEAKRIPQYTNGPANIDADYRMAYIGEEELTAFIKNYLNIPNPQVYKDGRWENVPNMSECEARFDKSAIDGFFKGDFSTIKSVIALQPNNKVKLLFGVRTTDDGKEYQAIYTSITLKNGVSDYSRLGKAIQEDLENGRHPNVTYSVCPLREYVVEPTQDDDLPMSTMPDNWFNQ